MNRILFEKSEISNGVAEFSGARALHILNVLHGEVGQKLKTGELDGKIGSGTILSIEGDVDCPRIRVLVEHTKESLHPWCDLILAPPRPRVMKRLLPQLATMGVGRIFLVGARKVEKAFWGATLLKESEFRPLLVDGLMQGGASIVPVIEVRRNFLKFVTDEVDSLFPGSERIVAHPYAEGEQGAGAMDRAGRLLLAVGPEGGWTDGEVELLESRGFKRYSLGKRILRTDTATIALLAKLSTELC